MKKMFLSATLLVALTTVTMSFISVPSQTNDVIPPDLPVYVTAWFVNHNNRNLPFAEKECAIDYVTRTPGATFNGAGVAYPHELWYCY